MIPSKGSIHSTFNNMKINPQIISLAGNLYGQFNGKWSGGSIFAIFVEFRRSTTHKITAEGSIFKNSRGPTKLMKQLWDFL